MKQRITASIFAILLMFSLLTPVLAQDRQMTHITSYLIDGRIDFKKQAGHICSTGGEMKQLITGDGQLEKSMSLILVEGKLVVSDDNEFTTAIDAISNLTVTTVIELCTPPVIVQESINRYIDRYYFDEWWFDYSGGVDSPTNDPQWNDYWSVYPGYDYGYWVFTGDGEPTDINSAWEGDGFYSGEEPIYNYSDLTNQIWAVSVAANPGGKGILNNQFTAAYGPPMWDDTWFDVDGRLFPLYVENAELVELDKWARGNYGQYFIGEDFVGDYFTIDQYASVSDGVLKRYIDISNPYSGGMLHEDMKVIGTAEVEEEFNMRNVPSGNATEANWWDLLQKGSARTIILTGREQHLNHNAQYALSGEIDFKKQAGHIHSTGGELKQIIAGEGNIDKIMEIAMFNGYLQVKDSNDFVTAVNAKKNMTVSSAIELDTYPVWGRLDDGEYGELTEQIWATQLNAEPGSSGQLLQQFSIAYGAFPYPAPWNSDEQPTTYYRDSFQIEQQTHLQQGLTKRFIDISSWSSGLLHEDASINGVTDISEQFVMQDVNYSERENWKWWEFLDYDYILAQINLDERPYMEHKAQYQLKGDINFKKQAGYNDGWGYSTGAVMKQTIAGEGVLAKNMDISMQSGLITLSDSNDFTTVLNAKNNLTVTSVLELAAPPLQFHTADSLYWLNTSEHYSMYMNDSYNWWWSSPRDFLFFGPYPEGAIVNPLLNPQGLGWRGYGEPGLAENATAQVWAVSVESSPGGVSSVVMNAEAAHGSFAGYFPVSSGRQEYYDEYRDEYHYYDAPVDSWWGGFDRGGIYPVIGKDYVGNYFTIEQAASTADGKLKRYIDISSPWNFGYLHEDLTVTGMAEVKDSFEMRNLPPGKSEVGGWWRLPGAVDAFDDKYAVLKDYYVAGRLVENVYGLRDDDIDSIVYEWLYNILFLDFDFDDEDWDWDDYWQRLYLLHDLLELYQENKWDEVLTVIQSNSNYRPEYEFDPFNMTWIPPFTIIDFVFPHSPGPGNWWHLF